MVDSRYLVVTPSDRFSVNDGYIMIIRDPPESVLAAYASPFSNEGMWRYFPTLMD